MGVSADCRRIPAETQASRGFRYRGADAPTAAFEARAALIERFPQQTHLFFMVIYATAICICFQVRMRTRTMHRVDALIDAALEEAHGCNSAEHGIGVIEPPFLHDSRPEPELDAMRRFNAMH